MAKLISIIVPIYNTEEYLYRCVQSVRRQTYSCFELLLVDDGSQDGSAAVCEDLCGIDGRIRFLPRPHQGVSAARNAGLEKARGDYVFFLDSDDTIHPRLLEALLELCEVTGAVIGTESYLYVDETGADGFPARMDNGEDNRWEYTYMTNEATLQQFSSDENEKNFHAIGGKLVQRSAIESLRFDEKLCHGEDTVFVYQLLKMGSDAVILRERWYAYWKYEKRGSSQCLTVRSCQDSYQSRGFIWAQERKRQVRAQYWAKSISTQLRRWYVRSHRENNKEVSACLRELAREEARKERFQLLPWNEKCKYYMTFGCYPLYLLMHRFSTWRWQRREKRRKEL